MNASQRRTAAQAATTSHLADRLAVLRPYSAMIVGNQPSRKRVMQRHQRMTRSYGIRA